jgi:hypothetical protein
MCVAKDRFVVTITIYTEITSHRTGQDPCTCLHAKKLKLTQIQFLTIQTGKVIIILLIY